MIRVRYWIGALLVVAALAYLAISSADRNMVRYMSIAEVRANPQESSSGGVRMVGNVAHGSIDVRAARDVQFTMCSEGDSMSVFYRGVVPDTFKDGAEVVVEGSLGSDGHFMASTLLAKCPSKYEAEDAHPEDVSRSGAAEPS
jgi:cytochrome c-type biogenesis protein CcmE